MLPFWVVATLLCLGLVFTVVNFGNVVRWHVRSQNAADTAASAALAQDANMNNQISMMLYAATVDEYRIRTLNQAILDNLSQSNCSADCASEYASLVTDLNGAIAAYGEITSNGLKEAQNLTNGGYQQAAGNGFAAVTSCPNPTFDCSFHYGVTDMNTGVDSSELVQVYACKDVPISVPGLIAFPGSPNFRAVAISAYTLVPQTAPFSPSYTNTATGMPYQADEQFGSSWYDTVQWSNLTVASSFYSPGSIAPYKSFSTTSAQCS